MSEDARTVARVRAGDTDAYAELVRRHAPIARRTAVLLGAGADADDVVQEGFVKAYRALGTFRKDAEFRPWVLRIVANEARNAHRTAVRRGAREEAAALLAPDLLHAPQADPAQAVLTADRRVELLAAVRELSEQHRLVVTCRYLLDLDEAETATVLGWPRGTVKSRLHRALGRLRSQLSDAPADREEVADA
jgi:RNA polymerase sigma-70 factor, ECF subfamily